MAYGLVIDPRGNPGGLLDVALEMALPFMKDGDFLVRAEGKHPYSNRSWWLEGSGRVSPFFGIPLVVLVDKDSASAAEIFAGILQAHGYAKVAG